VNRKIYRIMDANLNRSREGLRVCEDTARFLLGSERLTKEIKSVRHRISGIIKELPVGAEALYGSRDAKGDVGRLLRLETEMKRRDALDIFYANLERVKESLRVLEEFSKLVDEDIAVRFSALRYKVYEIERISVKRGSFIRDRR